MKVSEVLSLRGEHIEAEDGECYVRFGSDSWWLDSGSQFFYVYDCTELEKAYQDYREKHESQ